jgi:acetamidase/formamidase
MAKRRENPPGYPPDATLRSTPETVVWGYIRADRAPVLRIQSGQTVRIDTVTVTHQGLNTKDDPVAYFGAAGIAPVDVLEDAKKIYRAIKREEGAGPHILTGPVFIDGAEPGDMLEIRVLDVEIRVPYGINSTGPGWGAVPDLLQQTAGNQA